MIRSRPGVSPLIRMPALLLACALGACGGSEVQRTVTNVSIGQQLIDLKQAHDNGALSPSEYERQRRQIISAAK